MMLRHFGFGSEPSDLLIHACDVVAEQGAFVPAWRLIMSGR